MHEGEKSLHPISKMAKNKLFGHILDSFFFRNDEFFCYLGRKFKFADDELTKTQSI